MLVDTWAAFCGNDILDNADAAETLRLLTADVRRESRIHAVRIAAIDALRRAGLNSCDAGEDAAVALLCATELTGSGGPRGLGMARNARTTVRMPWAQGLGKGRCHARDGGAWNDAIRACRDRSPILNEHRVELAQWIWARGDAELYADGIERPEGLALSVIGDKLIPADALAPLPWQIAICGGRARYYYTAGKRSAALRWAAHYATCCAAAAPAVPVEELAE